MNGGLLVSWQGGSVECGDFVHVGELSQSTEKVIGRDCGLAFEETQPENLGALDFEILADLGGEVVVHDVLEVHFVQIVGPRVQHREALVVDALRPILHDVVANEAEICLVGFNRIKQVVFVELLLVVANKRSNRLDARGTLQVLRLNFSINQANQAVAVLDIHRLQNALKDLTETLKVPVLVDASVDDA